MFEDHVVDLFGLNFEDWMDENQVIGGGFVEWSELEILPDDHPEHEDSMEKYLEDSETAMELITNDGHSILITLPSGTIVEKSDDFPNNLLDELKEMAINGPFKVQLKEL